MQDDPGNWLCRCSTNGCFTKYWNTYNMSCVKASSHKNNW